MGIHRGYRLFLIMNIKGTVNVIEGTGIGYNNRNNNGDVIKIWQTK